MAWAQLSQPRCSARPQNRARIGTDRRPVSSPQQADVAPGLKTGRGLELLRLVDRLDVGARA